VRLRRHQMILNDETKLVPLTVSGGLGLSAVAVDVAAYDMMVKWRAKRLRS